MKRWGKNTRCIYEKIPGIIKKSIATKALLLFWYRHVGREHQICATLFHLNVLLCGVTNGFNSFWGTSNIPQLSVFSDPAWIRLKCCVFNMGRSHLKQVIMPNSLCCFHRIWEDYIALWLANYILHWNILLDQQL